MRSHTQAFKNEIKQYGRQLSSIMYTGSILIQHLDNTYNNSLYRDEINSIQYYYDCELFKTCMQTLVIDSKVEIPIGTAIDCRLGVKVNNANENLIFGVYYVNKVEQQKDKKSWLVTCYDKMIETMKDYESFYNATTDTTFTTNKNYYYYDNDKQRYKRYTGARTGNPTTLGLYQSAFPMTIRDYILAICNRLNISTMNISQETLGNFLKQVTSEHYIDVDGNKMGYTYRDVLDEIAKSLGEFLYISSNNLTHKSCISTDDTINEDYFNDKNVNIGKKIGPYNVVVLSRANDSDNIHYPAILPSNPIEYKITNNLILEQDNRQDFIQTIYNRITGLEFYTNDFATNGIMYYELGDKYNVSIDGVTYPCLMLSDNIKITTGLKENIHTNEPQQSVTDYKYSSSTDKTEIASRNAKILVDKANASIEQIVEAVGEDGEVTTASIVQSINDSGSQIKLNANKIYINGVTFDDQQKMSMTDGSIEITDNGTELIENSHITIQSTDLERLLWLTSTSLKVTRNRTDGFEDTRYSSVGVGSSYNNTNNTETMNGNYTYNMMTLNYDNQDDDFEYAIQIYADEIQMSKTDRNYQPHLTFKVNGATGDTTTGGSIKALGHRKNLFDKSIIVQGDITGVGTTRLNSRQVLYLSEGTYTFSCPNIASPYEWGLQIQNIGKPPLSSWPSSFLVETGWISSSTKTRTFTLTTGGWFTLMLRKSDNSTIIPSNVSSFNFQLEEGDNATTYEAFVNLTSKIGGNLEVENDTTIGGNVIVEKGSSTDNTYYRATRTDTGADIFFGVGSGGTNRGIYDVSLNKWLFYTDGTNVYSDELTTKQLTSFNDTSGSDWKVMLKNKLDWCISNITTTKSYLQTFINGGWQGNMFGLGMFSKINSTYQLVWFSGTGTYYVLKYGSSYSYYQSLYTGVIQESGSNTNGRYIKYGDGTLIQWNRLSVKDQAINSAYGSLYIGNRNITFPVAFVGSTPTVTCSEFQWGTQGSWGAVVGNNTTLTGTTLRGFDVGSRATGTTCSISWYAIGRWK